MKTIELGHDVHALSIRKVQGNPFFYRDGEAVRPVHMDYLEGHLLRKVLSLEEALGAATRDVALFAYQGVEDRPPVAPWPLDESLWRPFVDSEDSEKIVTYAASVPLGTLLAGRDAVEIYVGQAFPGDVVLSNIEYRVLGGRVEGGGWDQAEDGDVLLQISGTLGSAS